eukprot:Seg485.2 transcript_id=Seg485.2/GoldUCD/mRNA.D3Y31 product="Protein sprouty 2" protein_id=Seg485.2/GoldUCD/D3Y31
MISEQNSEISDALENDKLLRQMKTENVKSLSQLNSRNRTQSEGRRNLEIKDAVISDDGYYSLAIMGGKTEQNFLLPPTNSWPLRRKIGAKELQEYGNRLDSGSETLIASRDGEDSRQSVSSQSHSGTLLIERDTTIPSPTVEEDCLQPVRHCIDYCTCMICVKSAYYVCCDAEDDTGTSTYDPCYCGKPSGGCLKRWGCLGLLACFVPCIVCYPVARGCVTRYEASKRKKDKTKRGRFKIRFTKNKQEEESGS